MKRLVATICTLYLFTALTLIIPIPGVQGSVRSSDLDIRSPEIECSIDNSFAAVKASFEMENTGSADREMDFPIAIPDDAFLTNLTIAYNDMYYYGIVKEAEEAQQEYEEAVEEGKTAIKLEKISVTDFSMTINLEPDKPMEISFVYHQFLVKELGGYQIAVIPGDLLPRDTKTDISVSFSVRSQSAITNAVVENLGDDKIDYDSISAFTSGGNVDASSINQDIIVTYQTADTDTGGLMQFHNEGEVTYFLHTFAPGMEQLGDEPLKKDIVFVVDCSGSMDGDKMYQTKEAFDVIVDQLSAENDRFNIISFSSGCDLWETELKTPNSTTIASAKNYIDNLVADGGTNIIDSLEKGLELFEDNTTEMKIIVFLTDGNPTAGTIQAPLAICTSVYGENTNKISIFSLGVGYDMDFDFLKRLSFMNYARAYRIDDKTDMSEQIAHFYDTISTPLIYRLNMQYENADNVYHRHAPYLFEGQEHCVLGKVIDKNKDVKFSGTGVMVNASVSLRGSFTPVMEENSFISQLWAFMHIRWCEEKMLMEDDKEIYKEELINTAVLFQIVTDHTTMILVADKEYEEPEEEEPVEESHDDWEDYNYDPPPSGNQDSYNTGGSTKYDDDDNGGGSNAIPEFPWFIIAPIILASLVILLRRRIRK